MQFNPVSNLFDLWKGLNANQKAALGVAVLLLALTVMVVVSKVNTVSYAQLYGNLTAEDAAAVVEKLKDLKIPYRLDANGGTVEVPAKQVDELRLSLAGEGLPRGGNVGFELFDKTQVGQSEFGEHLKYQRALQGELARTIGQLKVIRSARVHLALPERRLYSTEVQKPTASVVLDLKGGTPSPREIKSVIHLVSAAVEGMDPVDVTVVDTAGNLLSDLPGIAGNGGTSMQLQVQREVETQVEQRVQSMLDSVLGPGKAIVRANVKVNFSRKTIDRERYTPADAEKGVGVLESENRTVETFSGARPGAAAGIAGLASNSVLAGGSGNGANAYSREENTTHYRVTKETEQIDTLPGEVERVSLALIIDEGLKEQLESLKPTIEAAAGLDTARGDQLAVQAIKFDTTVGEAAEKEAKAQARASMMMTIGKYATAAVLVFIFFFFIFHIYRSTLIPVTAQILPDEVPPFQMSIPAEHAVEQYAAISAPVVDEIPVSINHEPMLDNLDPARVAKVIKSLMAEESKG